MRFLANTGFLFPRLAFPERIRAAAAAGFDGVEFHDEVQAHDPAAIAALLAETGLGVGGLNLRMGRTLGCAALPGEERQFARDLAEADAAARAVGAGALHVVAGRGEGDRATYLANLRRALDLTGLPLLIEPICRAAVPDYHLHDLDDALEVLDRIGSGRISLMFDWYHAAAMLGPAGAEAALARHRARIGHVQLAAAGDRAEPGPDLCGMAARAGFARVGLEYRPTRPEAALLAALRKAGCGATSAG